MCLFQAVMREVAALLRVSSERGIYCVQGIRKQKIMFVVAGVSAEGGEAAGEWPWLASHAHRGAIQSIGGPQPSIESAAAELNRFPVPVRRQIHLEADILRGRIYRPNIAKHFAVFAPIVMNQLRGPDVCSIG